MDMTKAEIQQLNKELVSLVKSKPVDMVRIDGILNVFDLMLYSADALKAAVAVWNVDLIRRFIDKGALLAPRGVKALTDKAEARGLKDFAAIESEYLDLIEYALKSLTIRRDKQAVDIDLFEDLYLPYIHYAVSSGDVERLSDFSKRFALKLSECIAAVKLPIILNLINTDKNEMLALIENYRDWADEDALSRAVAFEGESAVKAVMYLLHKKPDLKPTMQAAAKALYRGSFELLDLIYPDKLPVSNEFLLQAANAYATLGPAPLEYLFKRGYPIDCKLEGHSLVRYAKARGDNGLANYLVSMGALVD